MQAVADEHETASNSSLNLTLAGRWIAHLLPFQCSITGFRFELSVLPMAVQKVREAHDKLDKR
jgi:hypothetical protein